MNRGCALGMDNEVGDAQRAGHFYMIQKCGELFFGP